MPSIYFPGLEKQKQGFQVKLEGEEFHHLVRVAPRRLKDELLLNSGRGVMARAELLEAGKSFATLRIIDFKTFPRPERPYAIAFALLKNRHDELIVEKCTELAATAFFPLITKHSVRQASDNTLQRFQKTALVASKQCDNPWLPEVFTPQNLETALQSIKDEGYTPIVCSERKPGQWLHHLDLNAEEKPCFLIGAEGGWSNVEFALFKGLEEISLGALITRAETAAIAISAQWLAYVNHLSTTGTTK